MPELLQAAKKFGSRSRHRTTACASQARRISQRTSGARSNGNGEVSAKMTFGEAAAIHLRNLDDNLSIKPRTRQYWRECLAALQKSWPGLNETEVRKITQTDCKKWARVYAQNRIADTLQQHGLGSPACSERRNRGRRDLQQSRSGGQTCDGARQRNRIAENREIQHADCGNARGPQPRFATAPTLQRAWHLPVAE